MLKLAAGNWKMNGLAAQLSEIDALAKAHPAPGCDILICPPAPLISRMAERAQGTSIRVGGQDCHQAGSGAHTGDISAAMLADAGATHVILGHSERRADHGETDGLVAAKASTAATAGLLPIICVGETLDEREAGDTLDIVGAQIRGSVPKDIGEVVIAYEPVWAIGTGKTATSAQAQEVHAFLRERLNDRFGDTLAGSIRILYGGSVKPGNVTELMAMPDVDGALVGGASLKPEVFAQIVLYRKS